MIAAATDAEADDKEAIKRQIAEAEAKIKANRRKQEALLSRFADADEVLSVLIENQIRALAESSRSLTADLESAREWLANDGQRHQRAADLSAAFESFSGDDNLTFEEKRTLLECLELRVETEGRTHWKVYFGVTFPEIKSGHSALNFQLFSAERPLFKDGRWFRFNR